jgi:hypothetical protein
MEWTAVNFLSQGLSSLFFLGPDLMGSKAEALDRLKELLVEERFEDEAVLPFLGEDDSGLGGIVGERLSGVEDPLVVGRQV